MTDVDFGESFEKDDRSKRFTSKSIKNRSNRKEASEREVKKNKRALQS